MRPALAVAALAVALSLTGGCRPGGGVEPVPIPQPSLEDLSPQARDDLTASRSRLDALVANADSSPAELGAAYRDLGRRYHVQDLDAAAEACYRNVLAIEPDDFDTAYHLGVVLHENGRPDEAIEAYGRALELRSDYLPVSIRLGEIWLRREPELAREYFERALGDGDHRAAGHYGLGRVDAAARDHPSAAEHFESALELQPGASRVHYSLGLAYRALGRREEAESHLAAYGQMDVSFPDPVLNELSAATSGAEQHARAASSAMLREQYDVAAREYFLVLESDPDDAEARRALGKALWKLGDVPGSVEQYREAVRVEPDNPNSRYSLGLVLTDGGLPDEAIPHLEHALRIDPAFREARETLARALTRASRFDEAIEQYRVMRESDPGSRAARFGEADALRGKGSHDQASALLRSMIEADSRDAEARVELGRVLADAGRTAEAVATLEQARRLDPDPAVMTVLLHNLGTVHARAGDTAAAEEVFRAALEIDPELADTRHQLAGVLASRGRFDEAAREYARVVEGRPRDARARLARATSLVLAENHSEARAALESALTELPGHPGLTLSLAKLLATCPRDEVRDGRRALELARSAWERRKGLEEAETVAMAHAELGAFDEAARWQRELVAQAEQLGRPDLVALFRANLTLYERNEPVRAPWRTGS